MYFKTLLSLLLLPVLLFSDSYGLPSEKSEENESSQSQVIDEKTCVVIDKLYKKNPYDYQINLDYGKCAYFRGDIDGAMAAYDRAEILNEEDADVHKHLGDLYAHIGNIEIANSEYDKADRFGKDLVERSLDSLYSSNSFSVLARFSGGYDSNVKYNSELFDMNLWNPSGIYNAPSSDTFIKEYMRLTHLYDSDAASPFYYKNQLHVYNKNYSKLSEDDFAQAQIYSGPGWASKSFDLWVPVSYTYMATDYEAYAKLYSINPQIRKRFQNKILLRVEAEYIYQKYLQWDNGDKDIYTTDMSLSRWFGKNYFRVSYRYMQVQKRESDTSRLFIDKYFNEAEINYTLALTKSLELGVGYLYNKIVYGDKVKGRETDKREDLLQKYSAYMSYNITKNIGVVLQYDNYDNVTNYTPSNYKKEVVTGGVYFYY